MPETNNPHDHFFKQTLAQPGAAAEFFRLYLPLAAAALLDTNRVTPVKDSFVDEELTEHFSDALYRVGLLNGGEIYIYILVEHKSSPDWWVALQLLRYLALFWEQKRRDKFKKLPLVLPIVFYHGKETWNVPDNFLSLFDIAGELEILRPFLPEFRYHLCDLSRYDDAELVGESKLASAFLLLKHIFRRTLKRLLPEVLRRAFPGLSPTDEDADYMYRVLRYLQESEKGTEGEFRRAFRQVQQERGKDMTPNFIDRWIIKGRTEGVLIGNQQGEQRGEQKGEAKMVMRNLKRRFGVVSEEAAARINSLPIEKLDELDDAMWGFQKATDLAKWLKRHARKEPEDTSLPN